MINSFKLHLGTYALAMLTVVGAGAVTSACTQATGEENVSVGRVSMALTSTTGTTTYRLSQATFNIDGPVSSVLSSASDPSVTVLNAELATGNYLSTLQGGWVLERYNGVAYVAVEAALVSANPANFSVTDGEVTNLVYQFSTDGTIVTMGTGFLSISIEVAETSASCVPFSSDCGPDAWCAPGTLYGLPDEGLCLNNGTRLPGEPCDQATLCAQNGVCADTGAATGPACIELCDLAQSGLPCSGPGTCDNTISPDFGVCN